MTLLALALAGCVEDDEVPDPEGLGTEPLAPDGLLPAAPEELPPNLLLVVLDDVGVDLVAATGVSGEAVPTPTLSTLADEGVLFPNTWGVKYCGPARIQLLTGRYTRRYGFGTNPDHQGSYRVPLDERYLPAVLADAPWPYASVAIGKWGVRDGSFPGAMRDPLDRGFLHHSGSAHNLPSYYDWRSFRDGVPEERTEYATTALVDDALRALQWLPEPWFLYLAPNAAHAPLEVPPPGLDPTGASVASGAPDRVDAVLAALDLELGRLLDTLPGEVRERTVVIVVGDNGSLDETIEPPFDPTRGKGTMFEGGLRVPLLVSGPGVARGVVSERLVDLVDVAATVVDLAGVDLDRAGPYGGPLVLDGTSLRPQLSDPDAPGPPFAWSEYLGSDGPPPWPEESIAVRDARFKLLSNLRQDALFDLSGPPLLEGADLLDGPLSAEAEAALARLRAERDRIRAEVRYEGP